MPFFEKQGKYMNEALQTEALILVQFFAKIERSVDHPDYTI